MIFFTIFLIIPLGIYVSFQYQLTSLEKETLNHLYNHGYREIDLKEVETTFQFGSRFVTKVTFIDEPQVTYEFIKRSDKIILLDPQSRGSEYKFKHWDGNGLIKKQ